MSTELKTPWKVDQFPEGEWMRDCEGDLITGINDRRMTAIVHRVNCHDKLVEALEHITGLVSTVQHERLQSELSGFRSGFEHPSTVSAFDVLVSQLDSPQIRSALELAKGGSHD